MIGGALLLACSPGAHSATDSDSPGGGGSGDDDRDSGDDDDDDGRADDDRDGGTARDGGAAGAALPKGTLLYVRTKKSGNSRVDALIARDLSKNTERVVTDLTGDGSSGWAIGGYSLSPDRRRIAIASLYGPTSADTATGLATRAIWTLAVDGSDFRRLTPTFPKDSQGRSNFQYEVGNPEWSADGARVLYDFGEYWWEGTTLKGGSFPWIVSAAGGKAPAPFPTSSDCSVIYPSRNPVTGEFVFIHSVCVPGQGEGDGLYLYPAAGSARPQKLIASAHVDGNVSVFLREVSWFADGSGFLFIGGVTETDWRPSLLLFEKATNKIAMLAAAPAGSVVYGAALAPDASKVVYCLRRDDTSATDLHLIDLTASSLTDVAITTDGRSCDPSF